MKDIKTTLAGLIASIVYVANNLREITIENVLQAIALFLMGYFSKDKS